MLGTDFKLAIAGLHVFGVTLMDMVRSVPISMGQPLEDSSWTGSGTYSVVMLWH